MATERPAPSLKLKTGESVLLSPVYVIWADQHVWFTDKEGYVVRSPAIFLQREVMQRAGRLKEKWPKEVVIHKNDDRLDCRHENLVVTDLGSAVARMRKRLKSRSQYRGVCFHKNRSQWVAYIREEGKQTHLGCYPTEEEAARAYDKQARVTFGVYARLNFP